MRRITARSAALSAIFLAGALALGGCSAGGGASTDQSSGGGAPAEAPSQPDTGFSQGGATDGGKVAEEARDVIVTGQMVVTAKAPLEAAEHAVRIVETAGGRVDGRTERAPTDGDAGSATLVLRIPADKLTATLADLKELGRTDQVDTVSADVTVQHRDLTARISALQSSIATLESFMARAVQIDDLITLEAAISDRQSQLESLEAQQRGLEDQIDMSTITLTLRSEKEAPPVAPVTFWSGLVTGWDAFVGFWSGLLVVIGVLLPWLVTAGLITVATIYLVRWNRKRRAARPQPPAPPMPTVTLPPPPPVG